MIWPYTLNSLGLLHLLCFHLSLFFLPLNWSDELLRKGIMTHLESQALLCGRHHWLLFELRNFASEPGSAIPRESGLTAAKHFLPQTQRWNCWEVLVQGLTPLHFVHCRGCSGISPGPIIYPRCCLLTFSSTFAFPVTTRAGSLQSTFPRLPCQRGSG